MTIEVKQLEGLKRQISFEVSSEDLQKQVDAELKRIAKKSKVQGFRPGKAPLSVISRMHGNSVRHEVMNRLISEALEKQLSQIEERVADMPEVAPDTEKAAEGRLAFFATFEVFPEVTPPDFSQMELKRFTCEVSDSDIEKTLDVLKKQRAQYEVAEDRPAQSGDRVTVDFVGRIDGVEFPGGQAKGFPFFLGKGQMLPEFEAAAEGLKAGEEKTFPLVFPEDYHGKEVAGKTAEFTITMKEVAIEKLPELDEDFAKSLGQEDGSVEKLIEAVRDNVTREVTFRVNTRTKMAVMDAIVATATFDVPKAMLDREVEQRKALAMEEMKDKLPEGQKIDLPNELFVEEATRRLKLGMLLSEIVKRDKLEVTDEDIRARVEDVAKNYEEPEQVVEHYLKDNNLRAEIAAVTLEDKVVTYILDQAKTEDQPIGFDEVMGGA